LAFETDNAYEVRHRTALICNYVTWPSQLGQNGNDNMIMKKSFHWKGWQNFFVPVLREKYQASFESVVPGKMIILELWNYEILFISKLGQEADARLASVIVLVALLTRLN